MTTPKPEKLKPSNVISPYRTSQIASRVIPQLLCLFILFISPSENFE